ncbi:MAG: glycosyltransferase [Acetobacteraceae bacterium]
MPIRLLTFSTLFPNNARPNHGVFVENRLRHLVASGAVSSDVVAPVPWFPSAHPWFGDWIVRHPRFPVLPRFGMSLAPVLLYRAMLPMVRRLIAEGPGFDAIDAHYLYPDGVAAVWLGQHFGLPVVLTARGTDVSLIPQFARPRRLILQAIAGAAAVIAVSAALRQALIEIGAPEAKISVLRNGVDTTVFRPPADRPAARAELGFVRPTLISVGLLIERKGHHRTIEAMTQLPDFDLVIIGEGPERDRLNALVLRSGLGDRVRLAGPRPHAELPLWYGAADASVLSSSREGWANVLLESMACGTPVVASPIWGNPEVVRSPAAGVITRENSADGIAEAVRRLFASPPSREATWAYAEPFSWDETTAGQLAVFRRVIAERGG